MPEITPIGVIRTPFTQSAGTPIQSAMSEAIGRIELLPVFEPGLRDLDGFDSIWLIYGFDRIDEPRLTVRPYLDTIERGVFATRAPARPNAIGMSAVRLLEVSANTLIVSGVDMLDGTPLFDIKPYVPAFDIHPVERIGWYGQVSKEITVADGRFER